MTSLTLQRQVSTRSSTLISVHIKVALSGIVTLAALAISLPGQALEFPQTSDRGAPERTSGGGTRGDRCAANIDNPIQAIIPRNNVHTFAANQASLKFYIPADLNEKTAEIFVKHPETHDVIYEQQITLSGLYEDGIFSVTLPATNASGAPLLLDNQDYFWEFAVICDTSDRSRDRFTQGFLHKVERTEALQEKLKENIKTQAELELFEIFEQKAERYAEAELWQETLSQVISVRTLVPGLWSELLNSVGLEHLSNPALMNSLSAPPCRPCSIQQSFPQAFPQAEQQR